MTFSIISQRDWNFPTVMGGVNTVELSFLRHVFNTCIYIMIVRPGVGPYPSRVQLTLYIQAPANNQSAGEFENFTL